MATQPIILAGVGMADIDYRDLFRGFGAPSAIVSCAPAPRFLDANTALLSAIRRPREHLIGQTIAAGCVIEAAHADRSRP